MKIEALRIAECGRFVTPVALEGLTGGLNVLAGPNELGKSTLLKALYLVISEKHTAKTREIEALRPYTGGAPTIEVDLEISGRRVRLTKRYLAQRTATLRDLETNVVHRGADAEAAFQSLLADNARDAALPLLWMRQGDGLKAWKLEKNTSDVLRAALAQEVSAIAVGPQAQHVRDAVRSALAELITPKTRSARANGRYDLAQQQARSKRQALEDARQRLIRAEEQLTVLAGLRAREAELTAPGASEGLSAAIAVARSALEAGRDAARQWQSARDAASAAEMSLRSARQSADIFVRQVAQQAALQTRLAEDERLLQELDAARVSGQSALARLESDMVARRGIVEALEVEREGARSWLAKQAQTARASELTARVNRAREAERRRTNTELVIARFPLSDDEVRRAKSLDAKGRELKAGLDGAAARLSVRYLPSGEGRIRLVGRPLVDREALQVTDALTLDIDGIGQIEVSPARRETTAQMARELEVLTSEVGSLLARAGVATCDDLLRLHDDVAGSRSSLATLNAELSVLAPAGLSALTAEAAAAAAVTTDMASEPARPLTVIEAELGGARAVSATAVATFEAARRALQELSGRVAEVQGRLGERRQQAEDLAATLPDIKGCADHQEVLAAAVRTAEVALNEAARAVTAWRERAPDPAGLAALETAVVKAESNARTAELDLRRIASDVARLEGELASSRNEEIEILAASLEEETLEADRALLEIQSEVSALELLDQEFAADEAAVQERYFEPVAARLKPYLATVFPSANVSLGTTLLPDGLARDGISEAIGQLSDGTQEQIAILARLAFGRLLADTGRAVPLILDDALIYADDQRIAAMFTALQQAAQVHQIVVLTCRETSFRGLEGNRLTLCPWAGL